MFNKFDLGQFVKTHLAQEIQKSQIGNFMKQKGAPPITASITNTKLGDKSKTADGIDMGQQVDAGVIPIIYGHVGMSNTQFDLGQKPSDVDAEFVTQEVKFPVSEGPIYGLSYRYLNGGRDLTGLAENSIQKYAAVDTSHHLKQVVINDSFVMDPKTSVANFKDIKFEMTLGDGAGVGQSATISDYNPLLSDGDDKIEAIDDPTDGKLLNDLGDVTAAKGVNYVLFWNTETGRWEAKSFNALLNETGATYDGGAGGDGGSGGDGGTGGLGGTGGGATSDTAKTYTQWNPPPTHTVLSDGGTEKVTTTITEPPSTGSAVVPNKGAPLRRLDQTLPYFTTEIDFADVDETTDTIDLITFFPDGIYKELTTVRTAVDATYTLCGTERPITGSGDLNCLTPNVTIAPDGQSTTTITPATGSVTVYYVLTTTLCGREFILDEDSYTISATRNGAYKHPHKISPLSMNAGDKSKEDGIPQPNSISGADECNTTVLDDYNFKNYSLEDYLTTYPDQILKATNTIKVYAWFDNRTEDDEYTISTNAYLNAVEVSKPMDATGLYKTGELTQSAYKLFEPDHGFKSWLADTESETYNLKDNRKYTQFISGSFGATGAPEPLVVQDGLASTGSSGTAGNGGAAGAIGSGGSAGTQGSVTVPAVPDIPTAELSKDSSYSGDGVADTVTLPSSSVANADAGAENTLTISVTQGSVDVVTVGGSVTAIGRNTSALTLIGTAANLQATLDSGLKFYSTTATTGDVTITHYISSSEGNSRTTRQIRSQAVTEYVAPTFTITVTGTTGKFRCATRTNKFIMNTITASGTTDEIAEQIKVAINDYTISTPNWTATRSGSTVTCTGPVGLGSSYNGIQPYNGATTPLLASTISEVGGGVSPSRVTQPKQSTKNIKGKFIPALAFTNTLDASDVSFAQIKYRPEQGDGEATLSEIGFYVGGMSQMEEPNQGSSPLTFQQWKTAGYTSAKGWASTTAWVFFDYLTNTRYGLGNDIVLDDEQKEQLYEDIYTCAQWCVHNPTGDPEIAASVFHGIFYGAESKFEALQKIADRMLAKFVYLNGNPRLIFDANSHTWTSGSYTHVPVIKKLVNQTSAANMMYQSGSIDNIFNVINVSFNNPANYFRTEEVKYKNTASIAKYGERETNIELLGCTNKQAALWHGAWMYETEASNAETVTYIAGWDHFDVLPGDLIHLNDGLRVDTTTVGARVSAVNGTTLTLDRSASGNIAVTDTSGNVQTGTVSGTTATMSSGTYQVDAVANVYSGTLEANYRVIAIEESEDGIYAVTAQKHDPDKYTRIWANTV